MTEFRGHESAPHLEELEQVEEDYSRLQVPVKVVEVCEPVHVHNLPSRECIMRSFVIPAGETVQILGRDLRRKMSQVWAMTVLEDASANIYIGTNLAEVQQGTAALLPVMLGVLWNGAPFILPMSHTKEVWVRNSHASAVTVSVVSEYWAD